MDEAKKPVKVAIVGLGSRGKDTYVPCVKEFPEKMQIVAIADIVKEKVDEVAAEYHIPKEMCFSSAEELLAQDRLADARLSAPWISSISAMPFRR